MTKKKIFLLFTMFFAISFAMFLGTDKAMAATATTGRYGSTAKIWIRKTDGSEAIWQEGILMIGNRIAYCTDYTRHFQAGVVMNSTDPINYFKNTHGLSDGEAQELFTELSLYNDYINSRTDLSREQKYFFGQVLVWNTINRHANWNVDIFWLATGESFNSGLFPCKGGGRTCQTQNDLYLEQFYDAAEQYYQANKNAYEAEGVIWDNGIHQPLMEFDATKKDYDYSYSASCASCENSNGDYLAYTIKDTSNWNGILASSASDNSNVSGYFYTGSYPTGDGQDPEGDVYCREEFSVYFPNSLSQIYVEPGRYFIMNPDDTSGLSSTGSSPIPNLKPYKVYRKRECKASVNLTQYKDETYAHFQARVLSAKRSALSGCESDKKDEFVSDMGKVWFRYNETYEESKYNMSEPEELNRYQIYINNPFTAYKNRLESVAADDALLTMENTNEYELPDNYYNYVRLKDGLSMMNKPSDPYRVIGIGNLPVSYENHGVKIDAINYKAADIQFAYDLPDNAMLKQAATHNGYLSTSKGKGGSGGSCISKDTIMGETTDGYSCKILTSTVPGDTPDDGCETEADAKELGLDWNSDGGYCCPPNTEYNEETGKCESGPGSNGDCETEEDAKDLGLEWNSKGGYCCPPGTEYNDKTGTCESKPGDDTDDSCKTEEDAGRLGVDWNPVTKSCCAEGTTYDSSTGMCLGENKIDYVCPESDCPYGCCPSGECAPMPTINGEPYCPGPGGTDVIYRTIDLEDPFPGQDAENRDTGSNWCSYVNGVYSCAYNNLTVKNHITREKSGGKKDGSKVYDDDHVLYEVTLDTATIKKIRDYNDRNKYDNWDLNCLDNGRACISKFLNSQVEVTGKCASVSNSNFYTCNKAV